MVRQHTDELDGMRAFAVWAVMLFHAGAPLMAGGWVGVDVFFVLSGFLIATLLMAEIDTTGTLSLKRFWWRRALRLMPAYFAYIIAIMAIFALTPAETKHVEGGWTPGHYLLSLWTYTSNFVPMGGIWDYQILTIHLWSLAVEQQFYLLMPVFLLIGTALGLPVVATFGLAIVLSALVAASGLVQAPNNNTLFARGISLAVGCFVAAIARGLNARPAGRGPLRRLHRGAIAVALGSVAWVMIGAQGFGLEDNGAIDSQTLLLYASLGFAIAGYWYGWSGCGAALLRQRFIVWSGRISYGIYLYHFAVWMLVFRILPAPFDALGQRYLIYGAKLACYFLLPHLLADLSYRHLERRFLRLKTKAAADGPGAIGTSAERPLP